MSFPRADTLFLYLEVTAFCHPDGVVRWGMNEVPNPIKVKMTNDQRNYLGPLFLSVSSEGLSRGKPLFLWNA